MVKIPKFTFIAIISFLILRGVSLEIFDFSEPTEARYAAIAADMVHQNNWVTPMFPRGLNHEPYLGKPPLYFWLVALTQKIFGFDEWQARLPSFVAGILTSILIYIAGSFTSMSVGLSAVLIWLGTAFVYFFSGSVMVDTILTIFISTSLVCFLIHYNRTHLINGTQIRVFKIRGLEILFWTSLALGFLTKGPVALIFTALPIISFITYTREFTLLKYSISIPGILLFILITAPWFIYAEQQNPGFCKYFFYNENFLRFFVSNYGDRYGTGHKYPYGSALWMLFLGMLPWSLYFLRLIPNRKLIIREFERSTLLQFYLCWGVSIPLFLCIMKQLHPGYLIPAFPGLALTIAYLRETDSSKKALEWDIIVRQFLWAVILILTGAVLGFAYIKGITWGRLSLLAVFLFFGAYLILKYRAQSWESYNQLRRLSDLTIAVLFGFFCASIILSKEINESTSPMTMLRCISANVRQDEPIKVSFIGNRSYTVHYISEAWQNELSRQIKFNLVKEPVPEGTELSDHVIVKEKYQASVPKDKYTKIDKVNQFIWFAKKDLAPKFATYCESGIF